MTPSRRWKLWQWFMGLFDRLSQYPVTDIVTTDSDWKSKAAQQKLQQLVDDVHSQLDDNLRAAIRRRLEEMNR